MSIFKVFTIINESLNLYFLSLSIYLLFSYSIFLPIPISYSLGSYLLFILLFSLSSGSFFFSFYLLFFLLSFESHSTLILPLNVLSYIKFSGLIPSKICNFHRYFIIITKLKIKFSWSYPAIWNLLYLFHSHQAITPKFSQLYFFFFFFFSALWNFLALWIFHRVGVLDVLWNTCRV